MKCFEPGCSFEGNVTEAKNHADLTGHTTGNDYIKFEPTKKPEAKA